MSMFLDSGAHSLYVQHAKVTGNYKFYESDEFWNYVDSYGKYVQDNLKNLTVYANVDVIRNPELSWKVQKYLERNFKISPLPVVHNNTSMKWLKKYMDNYEYIGIGGLGQGVSSAEYTKFADKIFNTICDSNGIPIRKLHGFAVTSARLMCRYPWYSVDSTTWLRAGSFGEICVPRIVLGKYDYSKSPIRVGISNRTVFNNNHTTKHISLFNSIEKNHIHKFVQESGFTFGKSEIKKENIDTELKENQVLLSKNKKNKTIETVLIKGISNDYKLRNIFNAKYFTNLANSIPEWPWRFKHKSIGFL